MKNDWFLETAYFHNCCAFVIKK